MSNYKISAPLENVPPQHKQQMASYVLEIENWLMLHTLHFIMIGKLTTPFESLFVVELQFEGLLLEFWL